VAKAQSRSTFTVTTARTSPGSVAYKRATVAGIEVFYREAGDPAAPKLLLLHGFPASSHQYRNLMPALADRFHLVAPDYPGFGNTQMPEPADFAYTFDHLAEIVDKLLDQIGFTGPMGFYMQDYGGPIGNRLVDKHRTWWQWQVIQNANTYDEGFTAVWDTFRNALWKNRSPETEKPLMPYLEPDGVKLIYTHGHPDPETISPDNWNMDTFFLSRPNAKRIQMDLFYDYRTNPDLYPQWQQALRDNQPQTLVIWGQNDVFFSPAGGEAYLRDLPGAEVIRLDSGHFAVEDNLDEIVDGINRFYDRRVAR
jgi:pimeloyl-ACP methyl ester carboxylesterase